MTDEPADIKSELGTWLQAKFLSYPGVYSSVFGPDKIERRFGVDDEICFDAWITGEYWLTVRQPPGSILISHEPFYLNEGDTYRAKPLKQWECYEG
jgi:hypothetical protein